jgi:hypothetical protein
LSVHSKNHLPDRRMNHSDEPHHVLDPHIAPHWQVRIPPVITSECERELQRTPNDGNRSKRITNDIF